MLDPNAYISFAGGMRLCRLLNGLWQVSGAHGPIDPQRALDDMLAYHQAGYTTWDLADHYGPAEDFIGRFRPRLLNEHGREALERSLAFTKWVPRPERMTRAVVEGAVDVSLRRMGVERVDLLQFHWWEYRDPSYLDALRHLDDLRKAGKIRALALTNFETARLKEILDAGIPVVSNQVQYSLVDRRPEAAMAVLCRERGVALLTYGTFCGGLLSERYLGAPEPDRRVLTTASLRKYKQMIDAWGGWGLFQMLLRALKGIADRHSVGIANVAVRAILDRPAVAGVIVGARLGESEHRTENARVFSFALDEADWQAIETVTRQGRDLMRVIGDCGDEYRR